MKAYWFSNNDLRLGYGDGRQVKLGRTHKYKGPLELCESGLHASTLLIDALRYAPGHHLWVVELSGDILTGEDKLCASERAYLQHLNCEKLLREFARKQALINIEKIHPYTDQYDLIVQYLQTGDESIQSAAESAAESAANAMLTQMVEAELAKKENL